MQTVAFGRGTRLVPLSKFECFLQTQKFVLKLLKLTTRRKCRRQQCCEMADGPLTDRLRRSRSRPLVRDERKCGTGTRCNLNGPLRVNDFKLSPCSYMQYVFFWLFPRRLRFKSRRFVTLYRFHLHRQVKEEWLGLRCVLYLYLERVVAEKWQGQ